MSQYQNRQPVDAAQFSNTCRGKVRHQSKKAAEGNIRAMRERGQDVAGNLQTYRCHVCRYWHVGNRTKRGAPPPPLKTIRVAAGEVVNLVWHYADGREVVDRRTAPPPVTRDARLEPTS